MSVFVYCLGQGEIKMGKLMIKKANEIMERLENDPKNVSKNECLVALSIMFGIPESTLRDRYKKIKVTPTT